MGWASAVREALWSGRAAARAALLGPGLGAVRSMVSAGPLRERGSARSAPGPARAAGAGPGAGLGSLTQVPGRAAGARAWPGLAWPGGGAERLRCGKGSGGGGSCAGLPNDAPVPQCAQADDWRSAKSIYDFHALDIDGNNVSLDKYR